MKVKVTNLLAAKLVIVGLFTVPALATETFTVNPEDLQGGCDAIGLPGLRELKRLEANGSCTMEVQLESGDIGYVAVKKLVVSYDAGDFTAAALAQTFTAADAFPAGARLLGGRLVIEELIANSDGDHASSTIAVSVTGPTTLLAAVACDSVTPDSIGATSFTAAPGLDIGELYLRAVVTNTGVGANQALNTSGEFVIECLYCVV